MKDKIRVAIALLLFSAIGISYYLDGKSVVTKTIVAVAAGIWLVTMWYLRNHKNKN